MAEPDEYIEISDYLSILSIHAATTGDHFKR